MAPVCGDSFLKDQKSALFLEQSFELPYLSTHLPWIKRYGHNPDPLFLTRRVLYDFIYKPVKNGFELIVGGDLTMANSITKNYLVKIDSLGNLVNSFNPGNIVESDINKIDTLNDGSMAMTGLITWLVSLHLAGVFLMIYQGRVILILECLL